MADSDRGSGLLYQVDETPPAGVTFGLGLQFALLSLSSMMLMPMIVFRAARVEDDLLTWAVFASIVIGGAVTALQSFPIGRFGAGYLLVTGATGTAIAVCVDAISAGGPGLLATLILAASLFQLAFSTRLSLFRRFLTPSISGTVIMLIPVTVVPVMFGMLDDLPEGAPGTAALVIAGITISIVGGLVLKGSPRIRSWAPVLGIVSGSLVAGLYGLYDLERVAEADWFGLPPMVWPGLDLNFGPSFWGLLPAFLLVFLIATIRSISGSLAIQGVSWKRRRAVDFRPVQGAVAADALGNALSGLAGSIPNGVRSTTVSLTEITGVASRPVGVVFGLALVGLAFFPKLLALVLAIPGPVIAAYVTVMIATLFVLGMRMVVSEGLDHRKSLIVGFSFWFGAGCQYGFIFPEYNGELCGRPAEQRSHGRGTGCPAAERSDGTDGAAPPEGRDGAGPVGAAEAARVREGFRVPRGMGRGDAEPSRRGDRGDTADPARGQAGNGDRPSPAAGDRPQARPYGRPGFHRRRRGG